MNILQTIVEQKQREIALLPQRAVTVEDLQKAIGRRGGVRDFRAALETPKSGVVALIAEVKKASPSAGIICPDFDAVRIARAYEGAGASCLSVLTDEKFFQGSLHYLRAIRDAVQLPLLRKDFIIDERQILEAVEWGADAILLIAAILDDSQMRRFHDLAAGAGLTALVEVHDAAELDRVVAIGAPVVGVNNRDLTSFKVDLGTTEKLAQHLKDRSEFAGRLLVAESGIHNRSDVRRLVACGSRAILVGESLMRQPGDLPSKVADLIRF